MKIRVLAWFTGGMVLSAILVLLFVSFTPLVIKESEEPLLQDVSGFSQLSETEFNEPAAAASSAMQASAMPPVVSAPSATPVALTAPAKINAALVSPSEVYPPAHLTPDLAQNSGKMGDGDIILEFYRNQAHKEEVERFFSSLTRSNELAAVVLTSASIFNIPPALAFALCWEESRYNPRAINRKNKNATLDRGLFQLNDNTFPNLTEAECFNPAINAWYGLSHLRFCLDTGGSEVAGLAMYNAGATRVRSGATPKHTLDYVSRILANERKIEAYFITLYSAQAELEQNLAPEEETHETGEIVRLPSLRLTLLSPLGRR